MAKVLVTADDTFQFWREQTNSITNLVGDVTYKKANSADVVTDHEFLANHVSVTGMSFGGVVSGATSLVTTDTTNGYKLRVGMNVAAYVGLNLVSDLVCVISNITYASGSVTITLSHPLTFSPTPATLDVNFYVTVASYINELELGKLDRHGDTVMGTLKINNQTAAGTVGTLGTDEATFNLIPTTATTLNIGASSTLVSIGAGSGTTTVNNLLDVNDILVDKVQYGVVYDQTAFSATVATTSVTSLFSVTAATYRSLEVLIQSTRGTTYSVTKLLVLHDGTDSIETEYGSLGTAPGTFDSFLSGGNLAIRVTQNAATSTAYKISVIATKV